MLTIPAGLLKRKVYNDGRNGSPFHPVFMPQSAKDFELLGIAPPEHLWLCQEAAGDLNDFIGAEDLLDTNAPTYQNVVTNWVKRGVGTVNGTAGQCFFLNVGTGPNPATESVSWLFYFKMLAVAGAANRRVMCAAEGLATTGIHITEVNATSTLRLTCLGVNATGTYAYLDGAVHVGLMKYNRTASTVQFFTDQETVNGTYSALVVDAAKGFGAITGNAPSMNILWGAAVGGAVAEGYGATTLRRLGWYA